MPICFQWPISSFIWATVKRMKYVSAVAKGMGEYVNDVNGVFLEVFFQGHIANGTKSNHDVSDDTD